NYCLLSTFLVGNVAHFQNSIRRHSVLDDRAGRAGYIKEGTIPTDKYIFVGAYLIILRQCAVNRAIRCWVLSAIRVMVMDHVMKWLLRYLIKSIARHFFGGRVHECTIAVGIHYKQGSRCV